MHVQHMCPTPGAGHKLECSQYVLQGGDLMRAINNDRSNELRWSRKGGLLMLDIARGLTFLHANKVRCPHSACHLVSFTGSYHHDISFAIIGWYGVGCMVMVVWYGRTNGSIACS